ANSRMKCVLITGVNSYVGNSFVEWVQQYPQKIQVDKISLRDDSWKDMDFSTYDSILHVAGIAHRKETKKNKLLYYKVNRDLTEQIAYKAKSEGVKQFIFLSSMSVYGMTTGIINENTIPSPNSWYGDSKLQAEEKINKLKSEVFKVAILRPPMIYGKGCPGNYQLLRKVALISPVFPKIRNRRSMIHMDNLSIYMNNLINSCHQGLYFPQNKLYVNTSNLVKEIANANGKDTKLVKNLESSIRYMELNVVRKVFGSLIYDTALNENDKIQEDLFDFKESIIFTEENK